MRLALACAFVATIVTYLALTIPAQQRTEREQYAETLAHRAACLEWKRLPYTGHVTDGWPNGQLALNRE